MRSSLTQLNADLDAHFKGRVIDLFNVYLDIIEHQGAIISNLQESISNLKHQASELEKRLRDEKDDEREAKRMKKEEEN